jgi:hypothetical protein
MEKLINLFLDILAGLLYAYREIWDRVVNQKPHISARKIMKGINFNLRGPWFWVVLQKNERLLDFSKGQFEQGGVWVSVPKGQYRLQIRTVKWGGNPPQRWLVLSGTTIGARKVWWLNQAISNKRPSNWNVDM